MSVCPASFSVITECICQVIYLHFHLLNMYMYIKVILFDLIVLKQKMSVQEASLLIKQEHEIFYLVSN